MHLEELFFKLKSKYGQAKITQINSKMIEVDFSNNNETIIIQAGTEVDRFTVSYPKLVVQHNGKKKEEYHTSNNILDEGLFWILKQVKKNGSVLPAF